MADLAYDHLCHGVYAPFKCGWLFCAGLPSNKGVTNVSKRIIRFSIQNTWRNEKLYSYRSEDNSFKVSSLNEYVFWIVPHPHQRHKIPPFHYWQFFLLLFVTSFIDINTYSGVTFEPTAVCFNACENESLLDLLWTSIKSNVSLLSLLFIDCNSFYSKNPANGNSDFVSWRMICYLRIQFSSVSDRSTYSAVAASPRRFSTNFVDESLVKFMGSVFRLKNSNQIKKI